MDLETRVACSLLFGLAWAALAAAAIIQAPLTPQPTSTTSPMPPTPPTFPTPEWPGCQHNGRLFADGDWVEWSPCYVCLCNQRQVVCSLPVTCPDCPNAIPDPGHCCPICPDPPMTTTPMTTTAPPTPERPGCFHDGQLYQEGQAVVSDPCYGCWCFEQQIVCSSPPTCAYCENPIQVEGQCCPLCPTTTPYPTTTPPYPPPRVCQQDGRYYTNGETVQSDDPCQYCFCEDGNVICLHGDCFPQCDNPVYMPGQCCPLCESTTTTTEIPLPPPSTPAPPTTPKGCERDGKTYEPGQPIITNDPCLHCFCSEGGEEQCMHAFCEYFINPCPNPIHVPGQCCPLCEPTTTSTMLPPETYPPPTTPSEPTCERDGRVYRHGEEIQTNDPCYRCTCEFGRESCLVEDCFPFDCWNPVYVPGQCCPLCEDRPPTTTPPTPAPPCERDGQVYFPGQVMDTGNPCLHCTCEYSGEVCMYEDCYSFFFPCPNPVFTPGQCCPQCGSTTTTTEIPKTPPGPTPPLPPTPPSPEPVTTPTSTCERDGQVFQHGDAVPSSDPCEDCSCQDGQVVCYRRLCLQQFCKNPISVPGQCCPYCAKDCRYQKKKYAHGKVIQTGDPCRKCKCNDGEVDCTVKQCPKRSCKRTVTKPGVCCPVCDKNPKSLPHP